MISVCINTRDRHQALTGCLKSILASKYKDFEIIVIDQSTEKVPKHILDFMVKNKITYVLDSGKGAGRAKNISLKLARGEIVAYTDDDCLVSPNWLGQIASFFKKNKDIAGVFGGVSAFAPKKHQGFYCPCTVGRTKAEVISSPCKHWLYLGFGNNMAFRKKALKRVGGFRDWLGPGSVGKNADDAEVALRLLTSGNRLAYEPKIVVFHNRWLTATQSIKQSFAYGSGETACYGYYFFLGSKFCKTVVIDSFKNALLDVSAAIKLNIKSLLLKNNKTATFNENSTSVRPGLIDSIGVLAFKLWGLVVGFYYAKVDAPKAPLVNMA